MIVCVAPSQRWEELIQNAPSGFQSTCKLLQSQLFILARWSQQLRWRRGQDSNLRCLRTVVFKTSSVRKVGQLRATPSNKTGAFRGCVSPRSAPLRQAFWHNRGTGTSRDRGLCGGKGSQETAGLKSTGVGDTRFFQFGNAGRAFLICSTMH